MIIIDKRRKFFIFLSLLTLIYQSGCLSMTSFINPSKRKKVEINGVTCFEPPPDIVKSSIDTQLMASIKEALEMKGSIKNIFQRIREEIPNLHTFEVVHFHLCVDYANGMLDKEAYNKFLSMVSLFKEQVKDEKRVKEAYIYIEQLHLQIKAMDKKIAILEAKLSTEY